MAGFDGESRGKLQDQEAEVSKLHQENERSKTDILSLKRKVDKLTKLIDTLVERIVKLEKE